MRTAFIALALTSSLIGSAHGAETRLPEAAITRAHALRERAMRDDTAWGLLQSLTTDVGHRMPGTVNDAKGVEWAKARFKALGYDKVWTQAVTFPLWVRRSESAQVMGDTLRPLAVTALGGSPGGTVEAEVVRFDSLDALKAQGAGTLKGKIAFVDVVMPNYGVGSRIRREGPRAAAAAGAAAYVMRSAGTDWHRNPHTGMAITADAKDAVPSAALANPDADQLARLVRAGKVHMRLALDCGFNGSYTSQNVIGEITGATRPDEIVAIAAHLDSWDLATGAIDDGAGIATVMAAGHLIKQTGRPARTVRVIAFANEEQGLIGGRVYAESVGNALASQVMVAESDSGGGVIETLAGDWAPEADAAMARIAQLLQPLGVKYAPHSGSAESEMGILAAKGVAFGDLQRADAQTPKLNYFDIHHTPDDTLDKVIPASLRQSTAVYATWAWAVANVEDGFGSGLAPLKREGR